MDANNRKRKADDEQNEHNADSQGPKFSKGVDTRIHQSIVKFLVSSRVSGIIIGKGGETISRIKKDTGVFVLVSKSHDVFPGTRERVCMMNGTQDQIKNAIEVVHDEICKAEIDDYNPNSIKFLITPETGGLLIGRKGANIKEMKEKHNCSIKVHNAVDNWFGVDERIIHIDGEWKNVISVIEVILDKNSIHPPTRDLCYEVMSFEKRGNGQNSASGDYDMPYVNSNRGGNSNGGGGGGGGGNSVNYDHGNSYAGQGFQRGGNNGFANNMVDRNRRNSAGDYAISNVAENAFNEYGQNYYGDSGRRHSFSGSNNGFAVRRRN